MNIINNIIQFVLLWLERQNLKLREKNTEEMKKRQEAQNEVNRKDDAEKLVKEVVEGENREEALDEIRKKISS